VVTAAVVSRPALPDHPQRTAVVVVVEQVLEIQPEQADRVEAVLAQLTTAERMELQILVVAVVAPGGLVAHELVGTAVPAL